MLELKRAMLMMTVALALGLVGLLGACSSDNSNGLDAGASDGATTDLAQTDGASSDQAVADGASDDAEGGDASAGDASADDAAVNLTGCEGLDISWKYNGGMVAYRDEHTLGSCSAFSVVRKKMGGGADTTCHTTVAANDTELVALNAALQHADVAAALAGPDAKLYGSDPRPVDGVVLEVDIATSGSAQKSDSFLIGGDCGGGSGCTPRPAGLATLREALTKLADAQKALSACSGL